MADNKSRGELSIKVNVDVSEALVGLKAIQREAREATKALRELENAQEAYDWRKVACDNITRAIKDAEEEAQRNTVADDIRRCYE